MSSNRKRTLPSFLRDLTPNQPNSPPRKRCQLDAHERAEYFMGCSSRHDFNEPETSTMAAAERESRLARQRERMRRRRARETSVERHARLRRVCEQRSSRLHRETSEERNARLCALRQHSRTNTPFTLACQNRSEDSRTVLHHNVNSTVSFCSIPERYCNWYHSGMFGTVLGTLLLQYECYHSRTRP